jgi:hypothetical protein
MAYPQFEICEEEFNPQTNGSSRYSVNPSAFKSLGSKVLFNAVGLLVENTWENVTFAPATMLNRFLDVQ